MESYLRSSWFIAGFQKFYMHYLKLIVFYLDSFLQEWLFLLTQMFYFVGNKVKGLISKRVFEETKLAKFSEKWTSVTP